MTKELQPVSSLLVPVGSIEAYMARVNALPMLTKEEEVALARRFREQGDLEAAQQLVLAHLRYVVRVARGYMGYGLPLADLIQEGTVGLMKAVKRFDPDKEVRLVSFAVHWIKAEMHEYILKNWRIVKVATTKAQRKLFFNLRKAKKKLGWFTHDEVNMVAEDLGVTAKDVLEMEKRLSAHDATFDLAPDDDAFEMRLPQPGQLLEADSNQEPEQQLVAKQTQQLHSAAFQQAWQTLDPRSQDILSRRWFTEDKATLHELAAEYEISAERVRQIENAAMKKIRTALEAD